MPIPQQKIVKINQVKINKNNPRIIKNDKFKKLVKSIQEFPDMLNKRPLIVFTDTDGKYVVLGGNMRLKACKEIGLKEIPIILADEWTEEQKAEFLIKDNVGFGEWDWNELQSDWDTEKLDIWGLDVMDFEKKDKTPSKTDLIEKTQYYQSSNFSYISLFKKSKEGIELNKLKEKDNEYFERICYLFYEKIKKNIKNKNTCLVCPPPRRHKDWNLAQQIVLYLSDKLNCNFDINLFKANSLQKYNPNIELNKKLIYDNYVLIDDIITTGQTIEKCIELLEGKNIFVYLAIRNN